MYAFFRIAQIIEYLRVKFIVQNFSLQKFYFRSIIVFEISLNAVECVSGRIFRK